MENKFDFTNCEIDYTRAYTGANGNKIAVKVENKIYMLKFPPKPTKNKLISYTNSCFSEYISCKVIESLGIPVQKTYLGKYRNKIVVACEDFTMGGKVFLDFASIKNTIVNSEQEGYGTELLEILETIQEQKIIPSEILLERFWDMFICDVLLGNFDRHNGNWGFLVDRKNNIFEIAPIFDCGSCLFPQNNNEQMLDILNSKNKLQERIYTYPTSAIKYNGSRIKYYEFLKITNNKDCLKSLNKIKSLINLEEINKIIDETPYITDVHKNFVKVIIKNRKEKIIDNI